MHRNCRVNIFYIQRKNIYFIENSILIKYILFEKKGIHKFLTRIFHFLTWSFSYLYFYLFHHQFFIFTKQNPTSFTSSTFVACLLKIHEEKTFSKRYQQPYFYSSRIELNEIRSSRGDEVHVTLIWDLSWEHLFLSRLLFSIFF